MRNTTRYPFIPLIFLWPIFFSTLLFSLPASAELEFTGLYTGVMYSDTKFSQDDTVSGVTTESQWGHMKGKIGKYVHPYISLEGQFGLITDTDSSYGTITLGTYLRASKDYGKYKPYGLIGIGGFYDYGKDINGSKVSSTEASLSYGIGVEIFGSKNISLGLEYLVMYDDSIDSVKYVFDSLGIGFT